MNADDFDGADERFVHGLLGALEDRRSGRERARIERALAAIVGEPAPVPVARARRVPWTPLLIAAAAAFVVFGVWLMTGLSATAALRERLDAAVRASADDPVQRYEVRVTDADPNSSWRGVLDIGPHGLAVCRVDLGGTVHAFGRDARGAWLCRDDRVHRLGRAKPPTNGVVLEPAGAIVARLRRGYDLSDEHGRIVAVAEDPDAPGPQRAEVSIDPATAAITHLTLRFGPAGPQPVREHAVVGHEHAGPHEGHSHAEHIHEMLMGLLRFFHGSNGGGPLPYAIGFERAQAPELPADWFDAETHAR